MPYGVRAFDERLEGPPDAGLQRQVRREQRAVHRGVEQRGEDRLGAQPRGEGAAPGRERRGAAGPGRHHAVPLQDRVADRLSRRPGRQVPDHRAQRERGDRERVAEDVLEVLHGQVVPAAEQRVDPGRAVRRGELAPQQVALAAPSFVGRHHLAVGRHLVPRQLDPPRPRVGVAPGHDAAPVRVGAHRHPAGVAEPDRPAAVRDDHVVDRRHPRVEGAVDVVDRPRAEQRQQRVEAEVAEDRRRVADGEPAASVAVDLEQWPPLGGQHFDGDRVGAAHRDGLLAAVDHVVEGLLEDVLVVRHRVGDRPGHLAGVREVLHARDAREGEAEDVDGASGSSVASRTCA